MDDRSKRYARIRRWLWLAELAASTGLLAFLLLSGIAQRLGEWTLQRVSAWPLQVALYTAILWLGFTLLFFPLDGFRGFFLEHRFGLSTQKFGGWLADTLKQLAIGGLMGLALVEALAFLLRETPRHWWAWAAVGWIFWSVLLTRLAPIWLIPIFYRQKPLEDARLKERLERLMERCSTPVRGIFEINLSRTTRKANACLCGMGSSRRVLISDTLLTAYPPEEVEVVLAHEVGHHRRHHIGILILAGSAAVGLSCFAVDRAARAAMRPLGLAGWEDLAVLPLLALGLTLANLLLMPALNGLSRRLEAQADRFALEKSGRPAAFIGAMRRLAEQNLAEIKPPGWVEWMFYDHPSIGRRIEMAERWNP